MIHFDLIPVDVDDLDWSLCVKKQVCNLVGLAEDMVEFEPTRNGHDDIVARCNEKLNV